MAIRAINNFAPEWYTPAAEVEADNPARFKVRGLDGAEQAELAAEIGFDSASDVEISHKGMSLALRYGLVEWDNLVDASDNPIKMPSNPRARQALIPYTVQAEITSRIFELTYTTADDKKK